MAQTIIVAAVLLLAGGCSTIARLNDQQNMPNQIYAGTRTESGHNILDLPFSVVADTVILPYTIPRTAYNLSHPATQPDHPAIAEPVEPSTEGVSKGIPRDRLIRAQGRSIDTRGLPVTEISK